MTIKITETFEWDCKLFEGATALENVKLVFWDNNNTNNNEQFN